MGSKISMQVRVRFPRECDSVAGITEPWLVKRKGGRCYATVWVGGDAYRAEKSPKSTVWTIVGGAL